LTVRGFLIGTTYGKSLLSIEFGGADSANNRQVSGVFTYRLPALMRIAKVGIIERIMDIMCSWKPTVTHYLGIDRVNFIEGLEELYESEKKSAESEYEDKDSCLPGARGIFRFVKPEEKNTVTLQSFE